MMSAFTPSAQDSDDDEPSQVSKTVKTPSEINASKDKLPIIEIGTSQGKMPTSESNASQDDLSPISETSAANASKKKLAEEESAHHHETKRRHKKHTTQSHYSDLGIGETAKSVTFLPATEAITDVPVRYLIVLLVSTGMAMNSMLRYNMLITMNAMINQEVVVAAENTTYIQQCPVTEPQVRRDNSECNTDQWPTSRCGQLEWDAATRQHVQNAFYLGYFGTQLPAGRLSELWCAKYVFGAPMLVAALLTMVTPAAAYLDWRLLVAVRALLGAALGATYPAAFVLLAAWVPRRQLYRLVMVAHGGYEIGNVLVMGLTPSVMRRLGWEAIYYIQGMLTFLWFMIWMAFVTSKPLHHWFLSNEERSYLIENAAITTPARKGPLPCKQMLVSWALWSYVVGSCTVCWVYYTVFFDIWQYYDGTFGHGSWADSMMNFLPSIFGWLLMIIYGFGSDSLINKGRLSQLAIVRTAVVVASALPAILILVVSYLGCMKTLMLAFVAIAIVCRGVGYILCAVPELLAPNFAGTIAGATNTLNALSGLFRPWLLQGVLQNSLDLWRIYFIVVATLSTLGSVAYVVGASTDPQPWNEPPQSASSRRNQVGASESTAADQQQPQLKTSSRRNQVGTSESTVADQQQPTADV